MTVGIRSMNPEKTIKTMKVTLIDLFASKVSVEIIPYNACTNILINIDFVRDIPKILLYMESFRQELDKSVISVIDKPGQRMKKSD